MEQSMLRKVFLIMLLFAVLATAGVQGYFSPTQPFDEPLWLMRSRVMPWDTSDRLKQFWAIDGPAVNRWAYTIGLKASGWYAPHPDEPPCWSYDGDKVLFFGDLTSGSVRLSTLRPGPPCSWEWVHGPTAPRKAILAMRASNLLGYGILLILLWLAGRAALGHEVLAAVAVAPFVMASVWREWLAVICNSGDVWMLAGMAGALYAWLCLARRRTRWGAAAVGFACGFAIAAKYPAVLALAAFCGWAVFHCRGRERVLSPLAAGLASFLTWVALNPAIWTWPDGPTAFFRASVEMRQSGMVWLVSRLGRSSARYILVHCGYWWPFLPVVAVVFWRCRKEWWFAPVAWWSVVVAVGTFAGILWLGDASDRYRLPMELGAWFAGSIAVLSLGHNAGKTRPEDSCGISQHLHTRSTVGIS